MNSTYTNLADLSEFLAHCSSQSLPDRLNGIDEGLQGYDLIYGLLCLLNAAFDSHDDKLHRRQN